MKIVFCKHLIEGSECKIGRQYQVVLLFVGLRICVYVYGMHHEILQQQQPKCCRISPKCCRIGNPRALYKMVLQIENTQTV